MYIHELNKSQATSTKCILLPGSGVPRAVLDNLSGVAVKADGGREDQIERVRDREDDDHLPRDELGFDLVGNPKCGYQTYQAIRKCQCSSGSINEKINIPDDEEPLRDRVLEVDQLPQLSAGLGELDNHERQD